MDSLPEPSEVIPDEWAAMKLRFRKEGLPWDTLSLEDRLLQVWMWMCDGETNLRTSRNQSDKLNTQIQEETGRLETQLELERNKSSKLEEHLQNTEGRIREVEDRNTEVEEDNRRLALSLRDSLAGQPMLDSLLAKYQVLVDDQALQRINNKQHADTIKLNQANQMAAKERELIEYQDKIALLEIDLRNRDEINEKYKTELEKLFQERKDLAKKSLMKEEEVSASLSAGEEAKSRLCQMETLNHQLVKENMKLKYG